MLLQLYICGFVLCLMSRQFYLALLQTCCYTALRACIVMCRNTTNYLSYLALLYKHAVVKLCGPVLLCEYYELSFLFSLLQTCCYTALRACITMSILRIIFPLALLQTCCYKALRACMLYVNNEFECFIRGSKHEKTV